jgi:hypothetical protein
MFFLKTTMCGSDLLPVHVGRLNAGSESGTHSRQMAPSSPQAIDRDVPCKYHVNGVPTPLKSHRSSCK